jgi:hypothetical protein
MIGECKDKFIQMSTMHVMHIALIFSYYNFRNGRLVCQSRFGVRIPNRQTFEIDHKLDVWQLVWFINEEGGVIMMGFDAPYFIYIN